MKTIPEKVDTILKSNEFIVDGDVESICTAAAQLLELYADHVREKEPYAVGTVSRLEAASRELLSLPDELEAAEQEEEKEAA